MPHDVISISMPDGDCPASVFTANDGASGDPSAPGVLFYMDAGGIRSAVRRMAQQLADAGYVVLLPDLYYRYGPYGLLIAEEVFAGDVGAILGPLMSTTSNAIAAEDTHAFLSVLDARTSVGGGKLGAVGFCMGGGMAIVAAGRYSDRITAIASFHGGGLAADAPDSPHLCAPILEAELYIAAAEGDPLYPPAMEERFESVLTAANVRYTHETYPAAHGWMMPDFPSHDEAAAALGWRKMISFFDRTLKGRSA